jgi:competence protein ComEA
MVGDDWQALPGIGPKLAERIEVDRQKNGEFASLEDLKRVSGIGKKRIEAWRIFF